MQLETSANVIEVEVDGKKYTKVRYTRKEEIANCITHGAGALLYVAGLIYMMTISTDARTYATSLVTCLTAIMVYSVSTIYHAVQDTVKKFYWRKADHADIPFVVLGCSAAVCLLLSDHVYNYIAIGICAGLALISDVMCMKSVDKFKVFTMIINFLIGIVMFVAFVINYDAIPQTVKYLYLSGAILCVVGSIIFGIKVKYMHAVFHVFIVAGTLCFYVSAVLLTLNYKPF